LALTILSRLFFSPVWVLNAPVASAGLFKFYPIAFLFGERASLHQKMRWTTLEKMVENYRQVAPLHPFLHHLHFRQSFLLFCFTKEEKTFVKKKSFGEIFYFLIHRIIFSRCNKNNKKMIWRIVCVLFSFLGGNNKSRDSRNKKKKKFFRVGFVGCF
jgi:hypothetical protein